MYWKHEWLQCDHEGGRWSVHRSTTVWWILDTDENSDEVVTRTVRMKKLSSFLDLWESTRNVEKDSSSSQSSIEECIVSLLDTDKNGDELGCHNGEFDEESTRMKGRILHCESCLRKEEYNGGWEWIAWLCLVPRSTDNNRENTVNIPDTKRQPQMGTELIACQLLTRHINDVDNVV